MEIVVRPHLLSSRDAERVSVPEGVSLAEMVAAYAWIPRAEPHVCALVNGQMIPREWWPRVRPKPGSEVTLALVLRGGGGGGNKQVLQLIATVVLVIAANAAGAALAGTMGLTAGQIAAGITLVGSLALGALFKPPPIRVNQGVGDNSNAYTFQGQSNAVKPYGVIPRLLGKHRVYPDVVAAPYTTILGKDQYITAVYSFGYGPVRLEDLKIGEDAIEQYSPEYVVHPEFVAGDALQIYTSDTVQDSLALALEYNVGVIFSTRPEVDSASFDMQFIQGLGENDSFMGFVPRRATTKVEYRKVGDTDWIPYGQAPAWESSDGTAKTDVPMDTDWEDPNEEYGGRGYILLKGHYQYPFRWPGNQPPEVGYKVLIAGNVYTFTSFVNEMSYGNFTPPIVADYQVTSFWPEFPTVKATYWNPDVSEWDIIQARTQPFLVSMMVRFPEKAQWQFRVTQIEQDSPSLNYVHKRTIVAVRSMRRAAPVAPDVPVTLLELRVKATDQLSGVIQNLSALASATIKGYDGSAWVPMETSNPAWEYVELLQGVANKRPVPDSRIDWPAIIAWGQYCDTVQAGFQGPRARCNFVIDKAYTLWELLASVAANGRAMPTMRDNKYSVIVDQATQSPVQVFTPRNSWGLTSRRKYVEVPHALRVKWIDPQLGYNENQAIVYNDGFDENNATVFEELVTFGVTAWDQAHRYGRITLARGKLQQEDFTIQADIENIICVRGDLVGVAHDVMEVGGWSARIATRSGELVTFDAPLKPFNAPLAARARTAEGVLTSVLPMAPSGPPGSYAITGLPPNVAPGDLVVYGTSGTVTGWYIVKGVQPGADFTAEISLIEYAPGIWEAETGPIPPYVPQGGSLGQINPTPVQSLTGSVKLYAEGRYQVADVLLQWTPPGATSTPPSLYVISIVNPDGSISEVGRTDNLNFTPLIAAPTYTTPYGNTELVYEVAAMWPGVRGPGVRVPVTIPLTIPSPYPPLTGATATPHARGVMVEWTASTADQLAYYVVRYGPAGATWESAAATEQKIKSNFIDLPATFLAGNHVAMVTQEDSFGVRSTPVNAPFTVLAPVAVNIVGTAVQNTAFLRWGSLAAPGVPGEWNAQTTFQIEYYVLQKTRTGSTVGLGDALIVPVGTTFAGPVPSDTPPQILGKYSAEFAVINEQQEGLWEYCVAGVDIAGNAAPFNCITLLVESPDNYFLLDEVANILPLPETTRTNVLLLGDGVTWLAPIDPTETWAAHFESEGWDQPSDQVAAGFNVYAEPAAASGVFTWTHDYGQNLPSLRANLETFYEVFDGVPDVEAVIFARADAAQPWAEIARGNIAASTLLPTGTRYIRLDVEVKTDAARRGLARLSMASYRLDVRYRDDSGMVTTPASGQAVVTFNVPFVDVRSVQLTSADPAVAYARYQLATDQKSMTVYTFDFNGTPVGGTVSWMARGI